jgi:hypothetical protein
MTQCTSPPPSPVTGKAVAFELRHSRLRGRVASTCDCPPASGGKAWRRLRLRGRSGGSDDGGRSARSGRSIADAGRRRGLVRQRRGERRDDGRKDDKVRRRRCQRRGVRQAEAALVGRLGTLIGHLRAARISDGRVAEDAPQFARGAIAHQRRVHQWLQEVERDRKQRRRKRGQTRSCRSRRAIHSKTMSADGQGVQ